MKEHGAMNDTVLSLILPQLKVSGEISAEELAKQGKRLYDKAYSDLYGDSYVPAHGGGFNGGNRKAEKDAYLKHLKDTGRIEN